jgi:hypothetical protein
MIVFLLKNTNSKIETMQWTVATTQGTPPEPRAGHSCVLYGGEHLYIFGGGNDERIFNDLYSLDINSLTWKKEIVKGNIEPVKRSYHTANIIASKMILLGGDMSTKQQHQQPIMTNTTTTQSNTLMILDLESKRWDYGVIDSRPDQSPPPLYGHAAVLSGAKLWVIGGKDTQSTTSDTVSKCVYTLDTGIQGVEPIEYGRSTLSYDLHSLVNSRDMMSDVVMELNGCFFYSHKPFLRIRCPMLHKEYAKYAMANDSTLNMNQVIEQLAMKRTGNTLKSDYNGRLITMGFSSRISAEAFEAFLEYIYTDYASMFEGGVETEAIMKDLAFLADLFMIDRLYALCCQHVSTLESRSVNRKAIPSPALFNDMKKMFELSQKFVPQLDESNISSNSTTSSSISISISTNMSSNSFSFEDIHMHSNDSSDTLSGEPQTPVSSTASLFTNLSANPQYSYCDVIFCVTCNNEYERIGAHKCVLIARSNFFHRMLSQQSTGSNLELEITGIRPQVFKLVIEFLYTGNVTINFDVSVEMLIASEVYQLERLSLMCQGVIERRIHVHNVCRILNIADAYDINHLRDSCVYFIVHHMNQVKKTHSYRTELDLNLKKELKQKRKLYREQEGSNFYDTTAMDMYQFNQHHHQHDLNSKHKKKKKKKKSSTMMNKQRKHPDDSENNNNTNNNSNTSNPLKKKKRRSTKQKRSSIQHESRFHESDNTIESSSPPTTTAATATASVVVQMTRPSSGTYSSISGRF